ncbi:MAG: hybrid sensor histidine kinase/response regulator [Bacteroidales bacterium]
MIQSEEFKILIVDDTETNVLLLLTILRKSGFQLHTASNGLEALEKVATFRPDLILLDVMMPVMNGYETITKLKENPETADIPVMFLTALNDTENLVKGFSLGASDYIGKPFRREELLTRINYHLKLLDAKRTIQRQNLELERLIYARNKLYSIISHDLRSPIAGIKMLSEAINSSLPEGDAREGLLPLVNMLGKSADEVYDLLDNLLSWTRSQTGRIAYHPESIMLSQLVDTVVDMLTPLALGKGVLLKLGFIDPNLTVLGDEEMLKTIVRNIISNAIKFSFPEGVIELNVSEEGGVVTVSVSDQGKGIPADKQSELLNDSTHFTTFGTGQEKGSGLGLLLCKEFVNNHGGKLWFESQEDKGTTFFFTLNKA